MRKRPGRGISYESIEVVVRGCPVYRKTFFKADGMFSFQCQGPASLGWERGFQCQETFSPVGILSQALGSVTSYCEGRNFETS